MGCCSSKKSVESGLGSWKALSTTNAVIAESKFEEPLEAEVIAADSADVKVNVKSFVALNVKLTSDQGFKDLYDALTMPHSTLPNIGALELSVEDDYRDTLESRYLMQTSPEFEADANKPRAGLDLIVDMLQNLGPETSKMTSFKMSNMHILPPEQQDFARALGGMTTLTNVELWDCRIGEDAAIILGEALAKLPRMKKLGLAKNHLGADVKTKIENMFKGNSAFIMDSYD